MVVFPFCDIQQLNGGVSTNAGDSNGHDDRLSKPFLIQGHLSAVRHLITPLSLVGLQPPKEPFTCGDDAVALRIAVKQRRVPLDRLYPLDIHLRSPGTASCTSAASRSRRAQAGTW